MSYEDRVRLTLDEVDALTRTCLHACGADEANAAAVARTVTSAERDGAVSHGLFRLPGYCASLQSGKVVGNARPTVEQIATGVVRVDAGNGFAPLALDAGYEPLVACARAHGIAALALVRIHHFSALWAEIEPLARAGLAAMACTAYKPVVAPAGSRQPFFGTNPLAFGWPRGDRPPMVFDMATAAMAQGEIQVAARDGHSVPTGTGLDRDGNLTTEPSAILDGGVQLPFGGHNGSAISLMVELLSAGLIGEWFSFEAAERDHADGGPAQGGELVLAIDPNAFGNADNWLAHAEGFFARFEALDGGPRLPAARRYANRAATPTTGVTIPAALHRELKAIAAG